MAREIICQMVLYLTIYFFIGLETAYYVVPIILIRAGLNSFEQIAPNWDPNLRGPALELSALDCSSPHKQQVFTLGPVPSKADPGPYLNNVLLLRFLY